MGSCALLLSIHLGLQIHFSIGQVGVYFNLTSNNETEASTGTEDYDQYSTDYSGQTNASSDFFNSTMTTVWTNATNASVGEALVSEAPSIVAARTQINLCLLMEQGPGLWYNYDKSAVAVDMALDYANDQILQPIGFHFTTTFRLVASACSARNHAVAYALKLIDERVTCDAYIGGGCAYDYQTLYDVADYLNVPFVGVPAAGVGADADIKDYNNLARLSLTHLNTANVFWRFLKTNNYTTPVFVQDQDIAFNQQLGLILQTYFQSEHPDLYNTMKFIEVNSLYLDDRRIRALLTDGIKNSRVFILVTNASSTRQIMLAAHDMGFTTGDYVFMAVEVFASVSWGTFTWKNGDKFDQVARNAYRALMLVALQPSVGATFEVFEKEVKRLSPLRKTHIYTYGPDEHVDLMTSHFYDSFVFYASLVRDIFLNGSDPFSIDSFANWSTNYTFRSPIHGIVSLDENADRMSTYEIKLFDYDSGIFVAAFTVPPASVSDAVISLGVFNFLNHSYLPPNTPRCGFDGKNPICAPLPLSKGAVASAVVIPTFLFLAALLAGWIAFRRYLNKTHDPFWWRVFINELSQIATNSSSKSSEMMSRAGSHFQSKKTVSLDEQGLQADEKVTKLAFALYGNNAYFGDNLVALRQLPQPYQRSTNSLSADLAALKTVQHTNLQMFYGIAVNDENLCEFAIGEICQKGSLMALLEKTSLTLGWEFKYSIMKGIAAGMAYLHSTPVYSHGDLSAHTVLIDSRFVVKVTDYGMSYFRPMDDLVPAEEDDENRDFARLLWRAPELLRRPILGGSPKGDVFSFGIVIQQLILRSAPYETSIESQRSDYLLHAKDLIMEIKKGANPPQRPRVLLSACPLVAVHELMQVCWDERPEIRYTFARVRDILSRALGRAGENIIEHLINQMDLYAAELEHEAEEKMRMFMAEKERSEVLLRGMLPKTIGDKLRRGEMIYPEVYESATVQFSDIEGFSAVLAEAPTPYVTINIMNQLYTACDNVIEAYDVYKIETVTDCYLLVSGIPVKNGIEHAGIMASLALVMRKSVGDLKVPSSPEARLRLRVGINSGSCVASVVGLKMPKYCVFGDTVNTASRMESQGEPGKIQISPSTKMYLDKLGDFFMDSRGEIPIKGKGAMETFWLIAKTSIH